jgi:hypothetical protein
VASVRWLCLVLASRACCGLNSGEKTGRAERDLGERGQGQVCLLQLPTSSVRFVGLKLKRGYIKENFII